MAFEHDIFIPTTHAPFGGVTGDFDFIKVGVNWSAAAFAMKIATAPDVAALVTLANAAAGSQGFSATYDAAYVHPETGAVVGATTIRGQIDEATLEAISWGATPVTTDLPLVYDLLVTPSGEPQRAWAYGAVTIRKGVSD